MSLYTIVSRGIRRTAYDASPEVAAARVPVRAQLVRMRRTNSMAVLETMLAASAIGTAVLLGLAR